MSDPTWRHPRFLDVMASEGIMTMSDQRPGDGTLAAGDIARLAGVGKAAVSNWRRRYQDFPDPVGGTSRNPVFSLAEVEAWLRRHGKRVEIAPVDRVWQWARTLVDDLRLGDLVGYMGALLVLIQREPQEWKRLGGLTDRRLCRALVSALTSGVPELPGELPDRFESEWVAVLRAVADLAVKEGCAETFGVLCERYQEANSRRLLVIPGELADLMVRLAEVSGGTALDPACGIGELLLASHAAGSTRLCGQDANDTAARIAACRLLLGKANATVATGSALREDAFSNESVDAVVCNTPHGERELGYDELAQDTRWDFGLPPRGEPELAWVQHCLARVRPGGLVVMTMPPAVASRRSGKRVRANLLRAGALRAVVSLPQGATAPGSAKDLWILRRPTDDDPAPTHLLLIEAHDLCQIEPAWRAYLAEPETEELPGRSRSVRLVDLLDDEVDVAPARWLALGSWGAAGAELPAIRDRWHEVAASLPTLLPSLSSRAREVPMTTVGELIKAGMIVVHQAPVRMRTDVGDQPVLTLADLRKGRGPTGRSTAEPGHVVLQRDDVVLSMLMREPTAQVVTEEGALLGPQLLLFRVDPEWLDPHFLAGCLQVAASSGAALASSTSSRLDPRRAILPRLPLPEQCEYGEAFRRLLAFRATLREFVELGEQLARLAGAGLADGSLQPDG